MHDSEWSKIHFKRIDFFLCENGGKGEGICEPLSRKISQLDPKSLHTFSTKTRKIEALKTRVNYEFLII